MSKRTREKEKRVLVKEPLDEEETSVDFDDLSIESDGSETESMEEMESDSDFVPDDIESDSRTEDLVESIAESGGDLDMEAIAQMGAEKLQEQKTDRLGIHHDPGSDSSEDEQSNRNTIGNVPLKWYQYEDHIGYDRSGSKIMRSEGKDRLDRLLEKMDQDGLVTSFYDPYNDQEVQISREDLRTLLNIRRGKLPDVNLEPYMEYPNWFSSQTRIHPIANPIKPKSSFVPSRHEERKVAKFVQAILSGRRKPADRFRKDPDQPHMIWSEDGKYEREGSRLAYLQPPKKPLPGHEESFHPPPEYLPTKAERKRMEEQNELYKEDNYPKFIPQSFDFLRRVPGYERYAREVFERCLDLFMCPRMKPRKQPDIQDKKELLPDLPKPKDLQPFPTILYLKYRGHNGKVRSLSVDPSGQWLASGSDDGAAKVWEIQTGRCIFTHSGSTPVTCVCWHPKIKVLAITAGRHLLLIPIPVPQSTPKPAKSILRLPSSETMEEEDALVKWKQRKDGGIDIEHPFLVEYVTWHSQGDYFASVQPTGNTKAVIVHRLSHKASQNPFKKSHGRVVQVAFHPTRPHFIVMAENRLRIYDLIKQQLWRKLSVKRKGTLTSVDIHPGGENILVGGTDNVLAWYDLELSARPYKALKFHKQAIHSARFHRSYPLFATASDDGTVQVFHGMVYDDFTMNALIVPVKILKGHTVTDSSGVLDCVFHPNQPWLFTAGADGNVHLYCN